MLGRWACFVTPGLSDLAAPCREEVCCSRVWLLLSCTCLLTLIMRLCVLHHLLPRGLFFLGSFGSSYYCSSYAAHACTPFL